MFVLVALSWSSTLLVPKVIVQHLGLGRKILPSKAEIETYKKTHGQVERLGGSSRCSARLTHEWKFGRFSSPVRSNAALRTFGALCYPDKKLQPNAQGVGAALTITRCCGRPEVAAFETSTQNVANLIYCLLYVKTIHTRRSVY
ncbi:hypothetical protein K439DRAFT_1613706 [Ramaria rubella]|nr:hypothetical protein K439DRAFT_1613706 [Ramaria rubella]